MLSWSEMYGNELAYVINMSHVTRKPVFVVSDQVRLKPACSARGASKSIEILDLASISIILSRKRTTKTLIRLPGCSGRSASLLVAYGVRQVFSWCGSNTYHINKQWMLRWACISTQSCKSHCCEHKYKRWHHLAVIMVDIIYSKYDKKKTFLVCKSKYFRVQLIKFHLIKVYMCMSKKRYARKSNNKGCVVESKKYTTLENCLASLDKPCDADQLPHVTKVFNLHLIANQDSYILSRKFWFRYINVYILQSLVWRHSVPSCLCPDIYRLWPDSGYTPVNSVPASWQHPEHSGIHYLVWKS